MSKFVSDAGLSYFWSKLKPMLDAKVDAVAGKELSDNNFTDALLTKLNGIAAGANAYTHPNSGVTAGTYRSVTVNAAGHVTAGTNPTTLAGYGITDAAAKSHTHASADIVSLDASKLTGTIPIERIPAAALERCVVVADDTARFALTTSNVQLGDTVKVTSTGRMYMVVDAAKLTSADGYVEYSAGTAASVPWSGVTSKPTTLAGYGITDAVPTNHATTATTYGVSTASVYGHAKASSTSPKANGTAAVGSETGTFARGDHVHPLQTTISGNAGTATALATARAIDGVNFNGSAAVTHFAECATAAATAAKVVSITNFVLVAGAQVTVKFTVTNTAASPTLNVSGSGAKPIYYRGAAISAGYLAANRTYHFVYDGTSYNLIGDLDTNTTYSSLKNPYALTVQFNGTTSYAYDGSAARTLNITEAAIGLTAMTNDEIDAMMA